MGRPNRIAVGGLVYHVINRANGRRLLFEHQGDYEAFEAILEEAVARTTTSVFAWCVMPNHWHLIVRPEADGELSEFARWIALTHTQRWHVNHGTVGSGHIYQGRFKSFPIQDDDYFLTAVRYVERNPLRANLVRRAEDWRWSSLRRWHAGDARERLILAPWPVRRPSNWLERVNAPQTEVELAALRNSLRRGCPYGDRAWSAATAARLGLESTLRPRGRPRQP